MDVAQRLGYVEARDTGINQDLDEEVFINFPLADEEEISHYAGRCFSDGEETGKRPNAIAAVHTAITQSRGF